MNDISELLHDATQCSKAGLPQAKTMALARDIRKLDGLEDFRALGLAILATSNVDFLGPALEVASFADRVHLTTWSAGFNQIDQQVLDPSSELYDFSPATALIFARAEDIVPALAYNLESVDETQIEDWISQIRNKLDSWCARLSEAGIQPVFLSFARPAHAPLGVRDFTHPKGQVRTWNRLNDALAQTASAWAGAGIIDLDALVRRVGLEHWEDPKLWSLAKIAGGAKFAAAFVAELMPVIREAAGRRRKCLVLDLDNTLWGGIIGEDGIEGVKLGGDYPGSVYLEFQKRILDLRKQGVVLAVNSKNNPGDAEAMINDHPEMLLKLEHFVSRQINWLDKVQNLRTIAGEINIGLDSLVFVDDNPAECERVASALPEVSVFQVPSNLAELPRQFAELCKLFDGITISEEDSQRNEMYRQNQLRQSQQQATASIEEFLTSLEMIAEVDRLNKGNLARVVQLLQKTNQFNLTTRRHSQQFVAEMIDSDKWMSYVVRLKDKFGDNGIVLVALLEISNEEAHIDTFLMSCRVIGRTLERAVIPLIVDDLRARGIDTLTGEYIPTVKNKLVENLYVDIGFSMVETSGERTRYSFSIEDKTADLQANYITIERLTA